MLAAFQDATWRAIRRAGPTRSEFQTERQPRGVKMEASQLGRRCRRHACHAIGAASLLASNLVLANDLGAAANPARLSIASMGSTVAEVGVSVAPTQQPFSKSVPAIGRTTVQTAPASDHLVEERSQGLVPALVNGHDAAGSASLQEIPLSGHITASRAFVAGAFVDFRPVAMPERLPIAGAKLTSGLGLRRHPIVGGLRPHNGVDLAAPIGTPVVATSDGVVSRAGWYGNYGLLVSLEHTGGTQTRYGHLSRLNVSAGQNVQSGDVIGYLGSTGRSTGPHLHYELRVGGRPIDPLPQAN